MPKPARRRAAVTVRYEVDRFNRLLAPPHRLALEGAWSLSPAQEAQFAVHATDHAPRQRYYFKGALIAAGAHSLTVALDRTDQAQERRAQHVTLQGRWQVDAQNRLTFLVRKADRREDRLTLQGAWQVGPHHELRYRYGRQPRAGGHALQFDGVWDVPGPGQLAYRLSGAPQAPLVLRAALRQRAVLASRRELVFDVGVEGGRRQTLTLLGAWKLQRHLGLSFEIPYAKGRVQALRFEGSVVRADKTRITLAATARQGAAPSFTVTFTRPILRDAELFVRLQRQAQETSLIGGVAVRF